MASTRDYLDYVLEQLSGLPEIKARPMMGEYVLYCCGRVFGGIYDDRLLVKDVPAARRLLPGAQAEVPYPGGRPMLPAENIDCREKLQELVEAMYPELPEPNGKRRRQHE